MLLLIPAVLLVAQAAPAAPSVQIHGLVDVFYALNGNRPLDGATAQLDLLFLPQNSPMRADRRWC